MNVVYIFGIAILFMGRTESLIEDEKTDKNLQQRILLRKLQNFQETKPSTWNEVLADVLVNKIRIFSFKSQDKEGVTKDNAPVTKERTILTNFFSNVFVVYKQFIYDAFVEKHKANDDELVYVNSITPISTSDEIPKMDPEEAVRPTEITYTQGPKSEVEFVEPKYHGKITIKQANDPGIADNSLIESSGKDTSISEAQNHADSEVKAAEDSDNHGNVDPGLEDSVDDCAGGFVKSGNGNCVKNISRFILAVPNQCPIGYRKDWFGYCRKVFNF